ncbi:hypothetical protein CDL12_24874 [Handroanthus impetiginosus]|uniref:Rapid ALkalinization Factor n=1 Tax=Handroanthus impetiginosus TaxID=429701 RepID=A0A2G9GBF5_9LAMI|nr:hypothetical protein CDL12_24874 [Handroanthus impetiginosus]
MKTVDTKQHPFLLVFMLLFLAILAQKGAKSLAGAAAPALLDGCNATRIGDCLADEEFLMESETSRRFLAGGGKTITNRALNPRKSACPGNAYGNCGLKENPGYKKRRPCTYKNFCFGRGH